MDKEKILINTQFAAVFNNSLLRPEEFFVELNEKLGNIFDDTPITLPIPNEQQLIDIPVVQMRSKSTVFSLNIARSRADFFLAGEGKESFEDKKEDFIKYSKIIFDYFLGVSAIRRIAFVTRYFIAEDKPNEAIGKMIDGDFKNIHTTAEITESKPIDSFVRYAIQNKIKDFEINNLTTLEYFIARISGEKDTSRGVLITRDFNTNADENYSNKLTSTFVEQFIETSSVAFNLDVITKKIWPTQE